MKKWLKKEKRKKDKYQKVNGISTNLIHRKTHLLANLVFNVRIIKVFNKYVLLAVV